ncbi:exonuclease domain-containing protein [Saccharibacillus sp. CPCC 101409]|uniref:exonuclease domain-containing protein n=1 Tax=Saccharibacillus sp. CPCC 101409 TaxID=3058041 RepID=UPI002672EAC2|nr:exonuclease domain-containing protein [Saccharibacillus sp. CPCC 101409]MDO3408348.1 exonuclease domain-containing protein [Saccharibacillus sp. CPCC 101409]
MDFVAIDFETANSRRASVCAVGLVEVKNGEIVDEYYSLVNPHDDFDSFCIAVHGITPDQVKNSPSFADIWPELRSRIEDRVLVAHNASFDMSVLRRSAEQHNLDLPHIQYMCSCLLARKIWPDMPNHKLNTVTRELGLSSFKHHDAIEDARAAARIFLRCSLAGEAGDCGGLAERYGYRIGQILRSGKHITFSSSAAKSSRRRSGSAAGGAAGPAGAKSGGSNAAAAESRPDSGAAAKPKSAPPRPNLAADRGNPLYGKRLVFAGRLSGLKREDAQRRAAGLGALCTESVEWKTDYLVVGRGDYAKYAAGGRTSGKTQSAARLAAAGSRVRILSEDEFAVRLSEAENGGRAGSEG